MDKIEMQQFGQRIAELRKESGETQESLLEALGVSQQTLSRYEKGQRQASLEFVIRAAKYYNVSADYLLGLSNAKSTEKDMKIACEVTGLSENAIEYLENLKDTDYPKSGCIIESSDLIHAFDVCLETDELLDLLATSIYVVESKMKIDSFRYVAAKKFLEGFNIVERLDIEDKKNLLKSLTFDKLYGDTKYDCILMFNVFLQDIKNTLFKHIENLTAYEKRLFFDIYNIDTDYEQYKLQKSAETFTEFLKCKLYDTKERDMWNERFNELFSNHNDFLKDVFSNEALEYCVEISATRLNQEDTAHAQHNPKEE